MSNQTKKVEYTCQCGKNYGSCGEIGKFFLRYQGVSDTYALFHQPHPGDTIIQYGWFDDTSLAAFGKTLNGDFEELEDTGPEENELINEKLKF